MVRVRTPTHTSVLLHSHQLCSLELNGVFFPLLGPLPTMMASFLTVILICSTTVLVEVLVAVNLFRVLLVIKVNPIPLSS